MTIYNLLKERHKQEFANAAIPGTGKLAPRKGAYIFKSIRYEERGLNSQVKIAKCLWKPIREKDFIEDLEFDVAVQSFYHKESIGKKHLTPHELIDQLIYVTEAAIMILNSETKILKLSWGVIALEPTYLSKTIKPALFSQPGIFLNDIAAHEANLLGGIQDPEIDFDLFDE